MPLSSAQRRLVNSYLSALRCVDGETAAHCHRVARYAVRLAGRYFGGRYGLPIQVDGPTAEDIELGALLHDVGKLRVPREILLKPGALTASEQVEMRKHVEYGAALVCEHVELQSALDIILHHHERWDGTGYPRGLFMDEIPVAARLFSVVDAYDAMTSHRPYRGPMAHAQACGALIAGAGSQWEDAAVQAFISIPESEWSALRELA